MTRLARRLRAALALAVAAAIVALSPGLEAPRLFAQAVDRAAPVQGVSPVVGLAGSPLGAPSALTPVVSLPEMIQPLAPHLEAAAKPGTSGSRAVAGAESLGAAALALPAAAMPAEAPKSGGPAAADRVAVKTVDSAISYRVRRLLLATVAALTGAVFSQPAAGPALTRKLIKSAAGRRAVFSDYDDTLAAYNEVLPADMVSAVRAVKAAGKDFAVISDRGDEPRAHQLTVFESLASLPLETRAGMYVAANSGGRVYRYDAAGAPVRVFEAPELDEAAKAVVAEAAAATKARLKELGAEIHVPSAANDNPTESWGAYGYALMLKVGSSNAQVRGAADILQAELRKRGLAVEVNPRFAKDPANPPYVNFSIVTKKTPASYIAKALELEAEDVLVVGDSMYAPHEARKASWLTRLGARLSGRALPQTGNRTDANMEKAVPGALTLGVGATGDPRAANLWVLGGKGPSVTREVLMSVASKSRAEIDAKAARRVFFAAAAIVAAVAGSYFLIGHSLIDWVRQAEQGLRQQGPEFMGGGAMLGGIFGGLSGKMSARSETEKREEFPLSRKGPIDFRWVEYVEALSAARVHAVALGYAPDNLRVIGARLSPRGVRGEDWTFTFVAPREGYIKEPRAFELSAHGLKDLGRARLFAGFRAADLPDFVKIGPMDAARKSGDAARALELQARWTGPQGEPELWYVVLGDKGRELSAINAKTGEELKADRWAGVRSALFTLGALAATAGLYALIYWAIAHAPAATTTDGWQGGPPSGQIDLLFGGTLGAGLSGIRALGKAKVSDADIAAAAESVVASKGGIWSRTEYDMGYYAAIENLAKRGATKAQLERFRRLCDEAPVIGGRFNPWSGD